MPAFRICLASQEIRRTQKRGADIATHEFAACGRYLHRSAAKHVFSCGSEIQNRFGGISQLTAHFPRRAGWISRFILQDRA